MVDLLALAQGFQAIRSASDIAQTMIGLRDAAKLLEKTVELNRKIADAQAALFAAQQEQAALVKSVEQLEKENARFKAWDREKRRYQLLELPPGVWIRRLKETAAKAGEPIHSICDTCYGNDKKSLLHKGETNHGEFPLICYTCNTEFWIGTFNPPSRAINRRPRA